MTAPTTPPPSGRSAQWISRGYVNVGSYLRGRIKHLLVVDGRVWSSRPGGSSTRLIVSQDGLPYTIGIRHVQDTEGAIDHLRRLRARWTKQQEATAPPTRVCTLLCPRVVAGTTCPWGRLCLHLHVDAAGLDKRRPWGRAERRRPLRVPHTAP